MTTYFKLSTRSQLEEHVSNLTVYYYGSPKEGEAAKPFMVSERKAGRPSVLREARSFDGVAAECSKVVILPGVQEPRRQQIAAVYGDKIADAEPTAIFRVDADATVIKAAPPVSAEAGEVIPTYRRRRVSGRSKSDADGESNG